MTSDFQLDWVFQYNPDVHQAHLYLDLSAVRFAAKTFLSSNVMATSISPLLISYIICDQRVIHNASG